MSIVPKETVEVIAQSIGISNFSTDAALALAPDVEYRIREIMQEAIKCMRHSRRTTLTTDDVDEALKLRNVEPVYGFASGGPLRFRRAIGYRDLFYLDDKDVEFKDVIEAPLPRAPLDTSIVCHWLAIEGVQPVIPENAPVQGYNFLWQNSYTGGLECNVVCGRLAIAAPSNGTNNEQKDGLPVEIKLPVKHILSRELQLYFDKITELAVSRSDSVLFKQALVSLATDSGLHPLVPYFTYFVADEVSRGLNNYSLLFALMRVVWNLLQNPHIQIEPYLHQLMPSVVTCLVAKRLGNRLADNHWELRDFTAKLVAAICKRYGHVYNTLQTRLTKTLLNALLDPKRALTQHYGAVQGLAALGPNVVRLLLLPNLGPYLSLLEPEMLLEKQKNEVKRHEAWRVYGALLQAAGQCIYDRLKIFPPLSSLPARSVWKTNGIVATLSNKRKTSMDLEEQPPLKKIATDGPVDAVSTSSMPTPMEEDATAATPLDNSDADHPSPSSVQIPPDSGSESRSKRDKGDSQAQKLSAILPQVWKDDLNSGKLLVSLFELFGEGILSFIPAPEMSLFL
ncbi:transcription initiation factor TFIID subunit 6 [Citrus sinensis]|uniref:transcription initiation factor TFIID subunit 6 isoform X1 n=1 Tax=Citrus sinensis TaxID=2711 RepID=UPI000D62E6CE|nr:transcription initiation factor TFIID subunit 6 isoform X1 [Citrus sinensis]KAH9745073.1 transcription initiation factor TFIID subunit 6 [Citrus sinensis]